MKEVLMVILVGVLAAVLAAILAKYYENLLKRMKERNLWQRVKSYWMR